MDYKTKYYKTARHNKRTTKIESVIFLMYHNLFVCVFFFSLCSFILQYHFALVSKKIFLLHYACLTLYCTPESCGSLASPPVSVASSSPARKLAQKLFFFLDIKKLELIFDQWGLMQNRQWNNEKKNEKKKGKELEMCLGTSPRIRHIAIWKRKDDSNFLVRIEEL